MAGNMNSGRCRKSSTAAKGHKSRAEIIDLKTVEGVRGSTRVECPGWIEDCDIRADFAKYARFMDEIGTWSSRYDAEMAAFVVAKAQFEAWAIEHNRQLQTGNVESAAKALNAQDKAYREMHSAATALGLNVSGHLKLAGSAEQPEPERLEL